MMRNFPQEVTIDLEILLTPHKNWVTLMIPAQRKKRNFVSMVLFLFKKIIFIVIYWYT